MKIDIIGSVASGKTTLAKNISLKYGVPYFEKDNWIVEGSPRKNLQESFDTCDYIIVLNIRTHIRLYRVLKRWILQKSGKISYNSKPTVRFLMYNIKWVFEYNFMRKDLVESLSKYGEKCYVFNNSAQALQFIEEKSLLSDRNSEV